MDRLFGGVYEGKRVFVTGHTGFKGSWLSFWLSKLGASVYGYSLDYPSSPCHHCLLPMDKNMISVQGDVRDLPRLTRTMKMAKPDVVFHLAAQALVRKSYEATHETFGTNIMGVVNLLEAAKNTKSVQAVEVITSDKCYQNKEHGVAFKEEDPMGGVDPYSASKGAAEIVTASYRDSFDLNVATCRAGNVIGGGDWAQDRLIPDIVRAAHKGESVSIRNPRSTRPWQHVLDPLRGYLMLGEKLMMGKREFAQAWNFGPTTGESLEVKKVAQIAKKAWGDVSLVFDKSKSGPHEAKFLGLDSTKARKKLGWESVWSSEEAVEKAIVWYKEYYKNSNVVTTEQLGDYLEDLG